uniref:Uncharacterized protein n=1 Tax=Steinernema glaseri TaxID=37863 RepID=A0A1I7ZV96_9BILA
MGAVAPAAAAMTTAAPSPQLITDDARRANEYGREDIRRVRGARLSGGAVRHEICETAREAPEFKSESEKGCRRVLGRGRRARDGGSAAGRRRDTQRRSTSLASSLTPSPPKPSYPDGEADDVCGTASVQTARNAVPSTTAAVGRSPPGRLSLARSLFSGVKRRCEGTDQTRRPRNSKRQNKASTFGQRRIDGAPSVDNAARLAVDPRTPSVVAMTARAGSRLVDCTNNGRTTHSAS